MHRIYESALCALLAAVAVAGAAPAVAEQPDQPTMRSPIGSRIYNRAAGPRIVPPETSALTDVERDAIGNPPTGQPVLEVLRTCARNPALCKIWLPFARFIETTETGLSRREREILISRTAWLSGDAFNWYAHSGNLKRNKEASNEEIERIKAGPTGKGWSPFDSALLQAADDLHFSQFIGEATWKALRQHYNDSQLISVIFTVGEYTMLAMFENSAAVALPANVSPLPKHRPR